MSPAAEAARAERLQRAAIVGQLIDGILHDFNNVLTVIMGMIDLLAPAVADEPQLAGAARLIDEAATRGAALTARLLAFARGQPAEPREVDVVRLIDEAVRLLRPTLGGIEVIVATHAQAPTALADPGQLMAAILSLAITARNAMPEGGKLVFSAGHAEDAMVMIAIDAHGYGEVAQHPESIFSDVGISAISSRGAADVSIFPRHPVNARGAKSSACRKARDG